MTVVFFSTNINIIDEWKAKHNFESMVSCSDVDSLLDEIKKSKEYIIIADYNTVSHDINSLISSSRLPEYVIVLETAPEITTGKLLISRGVKAYGNSRMLSLHYMQMIETVIDKKIWTYPELTSALIKTTKKVALNPEAKELIERRLTPREIEVTHLVLKGLTNSAIASNLNITLRTVKAHISSIFNKLHINDRISLVLLLK